jgi:hypothetical protein
MLKSIYNGRGENNPLGLKGIEFTLCRTKENIGIPGFSGNAARQRADKWLVRLNPSPDWMRLQLEMQHTMQMTGGQELPALPSGEELTDTVDVSTETIPATPAPQVDATGEVIPAPVIEAMKVKTPKNALLGDLKMADLYKLIEWYSSPKITDQQKKEYAALMQAVDIVLDWRMSNDPK